MSTKPVRHVKVVTSKDGKTRLAKVRTYKAKNKKLAADREVKRWQEKVKIRLDDPVIKDAIRANHERSMAGNKAKKAAHDAKAWEKKNPRPKPGAE